MPNNNPNHDIHGQNKEFVVIVNGRPKTVTEKFLSFVDVVKLAFGDFVDNSSRIYTMTFKKGVDKREGSMVMGDEVRIKSGVIFNVTATDKS
ncbi:hypothetical protein AT00_09205 [Pseudoalteromonas lipolytica SCSIO 04301]|uniref:multiubiquitin domain-containing protein n=1 Tax=Pseudoalteromonas lipolytica TaxID=570156 RepID=UPI00044A84E2|nr:multiubiquitin domain-containing protein [Pseudoalteromonas lipolytica]EWH06180.1 hypothetical protein AT00_09205 [Pseudoalteromonas lipolytica SCSIO 04301]